ncbi:gamma-tubulin complex component 4 homolog [Episyrphus balteatus]|uniref:gamma-tubulin complex component 4 homolog n=1 Tax=Episyrphus balteatus TaxID=286459 RepID=UPI00248561D8|nr:gamma-tubulin complex component 4 homolog [Episyrphus balteatus]
MIHDILLCLLNPYSKRLPIEEFVISDAVSTFLHPGERKILQDIIRIINLHRDIAKFTKIYGSSHNQGLSTSLVDTDEPLQNGLYLKAFANGIELVLETYLEEITELERRYLQNPSQSLLFIFQKINVFQPLFLFLQKLIRGIRAQKLHGCAIIQYLHQNILHGDRKINAAIKKIQSTVNVVFLKQLTHWILYAKIVDTYGEFFIQCSESRNNSTMGSERCTSSGSGKHTASTLSDAASTYAEIWRYDIAYEFLPHYLSSAWAEKVLFIGQTVLIFKVDKNRLNKNAEMWNIDVGKKAASEESLWNENEHIFFKKIQALQLDEELNVSHYERVIDEIKSFVTTRLSEIAVNQADLVQQLKLIKDFYLLGRGELFLEFIKRTFEFQSGSTDENKIRDIVKAFETSAHGIGITDELEQFSIQVGKFNETTNTLSLSDFNFCQHMRLQYKISWPLHLLFSPIVIERYNLLFRFLLLVKRVQYRIHSIWHNDLQSGRIGEFVNPLGRNLRNQLMFFVDNLQYYIQADVLESQFSILMNTILNKADFEQIQRAHSVFQANILSLCFMINDEDFTKISFHRSIRSTNPIFITLQDVIKLCEDFYNTVTSKTMDKVEKDNRIMLLDSSLALLMDQLINLLVGLKTAPSSTPLSQLLLRLDFNNWFSHHRKSELYQELFAGIQLEEKIEQSS